MKTDKKLQINKISWKASLMNYSATLIGTILYIFLCLLSVVWIDTNAEKMGVLYPMVLMCMVFLWMKLACLMIPHPITTYEVNEIVEK